MLSRPSQNSARYLPKTIATGHADGDRPPVCRPRGHPAPAPSHAGDVAGRGHLSAPGQRLLPPQHLLSRRLRGRRGCTLARPDECLHHGFAVSPEHVLPACAKRIPVCEHPPCQRDGRPRECRRGLLDNVQMPLLRGVPTAALPAADATLAARAARAATLHPGDDTHAEWVHGDDLLDMVRRAKSHVAHRPSDAHEHVRPCRPRAMSWPSRQTLCAPGTCMPQRRACPVAL